MNSSKQAISTKELHEHFYDCLKYFDNFCQSNGLTYIVMWGTLLGCAREGEIIPWDGDVDLAMPFDDYNRLMKMKSLFDNDKYELVFPSIAKKTPSNEMRIKINGVYWKQKRQIGRYDRRIAIDIFVATPLSKNKIENELFLRDYNRVMKQLHFKYNCFGHSNIFASLYHFLISLLMVFKSGKRLHTVASNIEQRFVGIQNDQWFCPLTNRIIGFSHDFFTNITRKRFGPIIVNCPVKPEPFLELTYGKNWKTPINRNQTPSQETYYIDKKAIPS